MEKQIIILIMVLSLLTPVIAEIQSLGNVKQYDCIILKQSCSNCTYNNITSVLYPNKSVALDQVKMTKTGTEYNYTTCDLTEVTGQYIVSGKGDIDGVTTVWTYDYYVTPTGTTSGSFLNNPILLILGLIGLILVIFGATKGIPWFGFLGSIMFLLVGVYTMIFGFDNINNMYTQGAAIVFIGLGIVFMLLSAFEWIQGDEEEWSVGGDSEEE